MAKIHHFEYLKKFHKLAAKWLDFSSYSLGGSTDQSQAYYKAAVYGAYIWTVSAGILTLSITNTIAWLLTKKHGYSHFSMVINTKAWLLPNSMVISNSSFNS
jgi:hypothetical protein